MAETGTARLSFNAKSAFITGASRGIGAATAAALARSGINKFLLHYNSFGPGVEKLADDLRSQGCDVTLAQADLSKQSGIDELVTTYKTWGTPVDILVNNAGSLVGRSKLADFTSDLYDAVMNLNVKSAWFITQAVAPGMVERGSGCIINLSSIAARNGGGVGATVYAAAKASISTMTKGLVKELAPKGVRVNAVSPGTVDNHFHEQFSNKQILDSVVAQTPAGRLGDNEEVADTIVFLCSDAARYIHGQTLEINGGMFMV